ncbi:MAG: hypothetical protein JST91_06120 [Actinobacteria bacterium]|nr:hypothetical protein [Actinomycetota bacterium]MBS1900333.1 hypothetical protein [Actinomycetota bacterium]
MGITSAAKVAAPILALASLVVAATISVATAEPPPTAPPDGSTGCETGLVPRNARAGDDVCVSRELARLTAQQNENPAANKEPNGGAYGPDTCKPGFVWREAFDGDTICVTPEIRAENLAANAAAASNRADAPQPTPDGAPQPTPDGAPQPTPDGAPQPTPDGTPPPAEPAAERTVVFEITGSGTVYSIDMDPSGTSVGENTAVPFSRTIKIGPDVSLLTVVAVNKTGTQGCRITLDGEVVAQQPPGDAAFCTFAIP